MKPKYWIYNPKTNSGRELSYGKDFVIGLFGKELFEKMLKPWFEKTYKFKVNSVYPI